MLFSSSIDQGLISCPFIYSYIYYSSSKLPSCLPQRLFIILLLVMKKLPSNIQEHLQKMAQKMTGTHQSALNAIGTSVQKFNSERCGDVKLRHIEIYPYEDEKGIENELLYTIRIKGRKNTFYHQRIIEFFMFVFDSYPQEPPQIIASHLFDMVSKKEKRFLHINVSESGHFCMRTNQENSQYYEYTTVRDILIQLQNTLYYPNVESSYNNELFSAYSSQGDNCQYYKLLNSQARLLQEDSDSVEEGSQNEEEEEE